MPVINPGTSTGGGGGGDMFKATYDTNNDGIVDVAARTDISALTEDASPDGAADYIETFDASASTSKKVLLNNFPATAALPVVDSTALVKGSSDATKRVRIEADSITTGTTRVWTAPDSDITVLGRADTATVQNKTLDNTNTATLKDTLLTIQDDGDATKQAKFQASGITAGQTRTFTLPDASDTLAVLATAQTLTNKTIDGNSNTLTVLKAQVTGAPTGDFVGTSDSQTLTNKTITQPTLTLKQGAAPTPTGEGDIQWDTDDNSIKVGDGAATKEFLDKTKVLQVANSLSDVSSAATARTNIEAAHSATTISAGTGLTGGGSLASNRTLSLDINGLTELVGTADPAADYLPLYDASGAVTRKVLPNNLGITGGGGSGYTTIQEEGSSLTARTTLDIVGSGLTATDTGSKTQLATHPKLNNLASETGAAFLVHTGSDVIEARALNGASGVAVANGDGVAAAPTISLDVNGLTEETDPTPSTFYIPGYDGSVNKKLELSTLQQQASAPMARFSLSTDLGAAYHVIPCIGFTRVAAGASFSLSTRVKAIPFTVARDIVIDRLSTHIYTLTAANLRFALYEETSATNIYPSALLLDSGSISIGTTGQKDWSGSVTLRAGKVYWVAWFSDTATINLAVHNTSNPGFSGFQNILGASAVSTSTAGGFSFIQSAGAVGFGAFPATYPAGHTPTGGTIPAFAYRVASYA